LYDKKKTFLVLRGIALRCGQRAFRSPFGNLRTPFSLQIFFVGMKAQPLACLLSIKEVNYDRGSSEGFQGASGKPFGMLAGVFLLPGPCAQQAFIQYLV